MPNSKPERSGFLTVLGFLALALGAWGGFFVSGVVDVFDQNVQRSGPPGGPFREGPRASIEPWVLSYCSASALLMGVAGFGLLLRLPWGPGLAGFAGAAWSITSFGFLWGEVRILQRLSIAPRSAQLALVADTGGTLFALCFGLLCLSCLIRRPIREECGAGAPTRLLHFSLLAWAGAAALVTKLWMDWLLRAFGL